jgi:hypothetical protein
MFFLRAVAKRLLRNQDERCAELLTLENFSGKVPSRFAVETAVLRRRRGQRQIMRLVSMVKRDHPDFNILAGMFVIRSAHAPA